MKWYCLQQSMFGDVKSVVEYPECERTRQLEKRGIIKKYEEKPKAENRETKGGKKAKSANKKVETKD